MALNVPSTDVPRIVIVGAGFAGITLARQLSNSKYQVVLIDKNNYHQFQPLFYQVATAGLEASSICFPIRKVFQKSYNVHIRMADVHSVNSEEKLVETNLGSIKYDYLVLSMGATTSFFGLENVAKNAYPMKSVLEAERLRDMILQHFEDAVSVTDQAELQAHLNIVIVGGGPTGVEVAGALSEMKRYVLPKDFHELDCKRINVYLIEASPRLLNGMSQQSSKEAEQFLEKLGVKVMTHTQVKDYDGNTVVLGDGITIKTKNMIWAAGITCNKVSGLNNDVYTRGNRLKVDAYNRVEGVEHVFALGDVACMTSEQNPNGHPQVAQVALQQAKQLAANFKLESSKKPWVPFEYKNYGSMATVGRNLAVVDLPMMHFKGWIAWLFWMFVHLMAIVGVKNRLLIFINWGWNYFSYDQSLRLIFTKKTPKNDF